MVINAVSLKCPECGAGLECVEGRKISYCSYCGTKVMLVNENEHVHVTIDEAEVKRAETEAKRAEAEAKRAEAEHEARMKELDLEEQRDSSKKKAISCWVGATVVLLALAILFGQPFVLLFLVVGIGGAVYVFSVMPKQEQDMQALKAGGIRLPRNLCKDENESVESACAKLEGAGFTNVSKVSLHDVILGILEKDGRVEEITVDGDKLSMARSVYPPDVPIVITYHGR